MDKINIDYVKDQISVYVLKYKKQFGIFGGKEIVDQVMKLNGLDVIDTDDPSFFSIGKSARDPRNRNIVILDDEILNDEKTINHTESLNFDKFKNKPKVDCRFIDTVVSYSQGNFKHYDAVGFKLKKQDGTVYYFEVKQNFQSGGEKKHVKTQATYTEKRTKKVYTVYTKNGKKYIKKLDKKTRKYKYHLVKI